LFSYFLRSGRPARTRDGRFVKDDRDVQNGKMLQQDAIVEGRAFCWENVKITHWRPEIKHE
jgi:hypothetical protein